MSVAIRTLLLMGYREDIGVAHEMVAGLYEQLVAIAGDELATMSSVQRVYYRSALRKLDLVRADLDLILDPRMQQYQPDQPAQDLS